MRDYHVYIMTNKSGTLYVGVTNDMERRVKEQKRRLVHGFTKRYAVDRLVYYEVAPDSRAAIEREKHLKGWLRGKKIALISEFNPRWRDLAQDWSEEGQTLRFAQGDGTGLDRDTGVPS